MQLHFKTHDHKLFSMDVDPEGTVEDLIRILEDNLGRDNLYKLIYAGKLLKEDNILSDYNVSNKIPIKLMVTKTDSNAGSSKLIKQRGMKGKTVAPGH